jgi:hypothetical protein
MGAPTAHGVAIIGAGVDVPFHLPTVPQLARELARFCGHGDGKKINLALRGHVKRVYLNFEKLGGRTGDALVSRLFEDPVETVPIMRNIRTKVQAQNAPLAALLDQVCEMALKNPIKPEVVEGLSEFADEGGFQGESDSVFDPNTLVLKQLARNALHSGLRQALLQVGNLSDKERALMEEILLEFLSVEDLLGIYFTRASLGGLSERKTYLYLSWILWGYLKYMTAAGQWPESGCFYQPLRVVQPDVITFNYTNFFGDPLQSKVRYFHGRLDHYLRVDDRVTIADDIDFRTAATADQIMKTFARLRLDYNQ